MNNPRQESSVFLLGAMFLLGSAIFSAATQVYYANKVQGLDPFVFIFISFSITIIVFNVLSHFSKSNRTFLIKEGKKDLLFLNASTAVAIITFYYALKYVEPAIVSAIEIGVGPLFALLLGKLLFSQKASPAKWGIGVGILIGSCFLFWTSLTGRSGVELSSSLHMVVGLLASLICGFAAVYAEKIK
ncbi:EamA family transporter [Alkalihalobacterium bogoriense]|uniref:EamA family transporter n=1 Tax=Alkalihalobacterium bogoriense TaxID=246272 RepID=UPI000685BB03|nr:EamA family transporter [Alkalihalobacterium bogoriense]